MNMMNSVVANGYAISALLSPFALYGSLYVSLRLTGTLSVSGGGWHAASCRLGGCTIPATLVLFLFQRPLSWESALRRLKGRASNEAGTSEVVVEEVGPVVSLPAERALPEGAGTTTAS